MYFLSRDYIYIYIRYEHLKLYDNYKTENMVGMGTRNTGPTV